MQTVDAIYNRDCISGMRDMPSECVDLIITDPPFAIGYGPVKQNYNRTASRVIPGYVEIPAGNYRDFTRSWIAQAYRILKPSGSMYVFSGWNNLKDILVALDDAGFHTINHIIWKYQFGVVTKHRYVSSHYTCPYVCKDEKRRKFYPFRRFDQNAKDDSGRSLHYMDKEDVWVIPREYWRGSIKTPTKLPAALIRKILEYSSDSGDLVFDPFLGSGQVAVVSSMAGRHFCGFEVVPEYYDLAKRRLDTNQYRVD